MNLFDLYAKISLDTKDYEAAVKDATSSSKKLSDRFSDAAKASETTKNKIKLLASQYSAAKANVERLTEAFNKSAQENGYASDETQRLAQELKDAEAKASGLSTELDSLQGNANKTGSSFGNLGSKLKSGLATAGSIAAKGIGLITGAAAAAGGALLALEASTEEYRIAQGKLNTAFEAAGYSTETAKKAYTDFYKILGDTDTATEASQLLAKLSDSQEDLSTWTRLSAGVFGTFGDSLPIEGLIESSNETAKVGQVTGVLADALNWAGINEDDFNEKLAACTDESERNRLIMETLSGTYDDAADAFYRNNEALVESRENQAALDESLAKVGEAVTTVKNAFLEQFSPVISIAAEKVSSFVSNIDAEQVVNKVQQIIDKFIELSPIITGAAAGFIAYKSAMAISSIIDTVTKATQGMSIAQAALNAVMNANPFVLIATLITAVVAALITLWTTNEGFRDAVIAIWETIKGVFVGAWEAIKTAWGAVTEFFSGVWEGIQSVFSVVVDVLGGFFENAWSAIKTVWNAVTGYFENIWNTVKGIFSVVKSVLSGDFEDAWKTIKNVFSDWEEFFSGLWDNLTGIFANVADWFIGVGKDIINGIWQGINDKVKWLKDKVNGVIDKIKSWFTGSDGFDEHSPSKWSRQVFRYIMDGGALGLDDGVPGVMRSVKNAGETLKKGFDFRAASIGVNGSVIGNISSVAKSAASAASQPITIVVQSVLDGKIIGETAYRYSREKEKAYGA